MIKNQTIIEKIKEQTSDDKVMQEFLLNIINHENGAVLDIIMKYVRGAN